MGLDDFIPSEGPSESGGNSAESAEKYKEAAKKAASGIKRTQKDESKARRHDDILAAFLVQIIRNKKYDTILDTLFKCLDNGYNSSFLLGILSLIYLPISDKIREVVGQEKINFDYSNAETIVFDDNHLPEVVKNRINDWVEDISSIVTYEPSNILLKRVLETLSKDDTLIIDFTKEIFIFFFTDLSFSISENKAKSYSKFIIGEIIKVLQKVELKEV